VEDLSLVRLEEVGVRGGAAGPAEGGGAASAVGGGQRGGQTTKGHVAACEQGCARPIAPRMKLMRNL
jgi:hypothetical protein